MSTIQNTKPAHHLPPTIWHILLLSMVAGLMTGLGFPSLSWMVIRLKEYCI